MKQPFPLTYVIRHRRENLKKCSLRGLESRPDFCFLPYPGTQLPSSLSSSLLLDMDGPPLQREDRDRGLLILDGTWRYAAKMKQFIVSQNLTLETRRIPPGFHTSYPRRQEDCSRPQEGLASIEAIFIAYSILGRDTTGLLDNYYWKDQFILTFNHFFT